MGGWVRGEIGGKLRGESGEDRTGRPDRAARPPCPGPPYASDFHPCFGIAFQPIVDLERRDVFAQEALIRGPRGEPARSVLNLVTDANRCAFDRKCRLAVLEAAARVAVPGAVSMNFVPNAVHDPGNWIQTTISAARRLGIALDRLILELTETERVRDVAVLGRIIGEFRRFGLRTAIDDFGAGFAGLSLLADAQPDILKIDMALVRGIDRDRVRRRIVEGIARTGRQLGITVVAEGVETEDERDTLLELGITLQQGFLFAVPVFEGWVGPQALDGLPARDRLS